MVREEGTTSEQHNHIELSLSEQIKQDFYKGLKDTNSYEQWRANIHKQLEEDLQRQVKQVLEETEKQERSAKLRRQYIRATQRLSSQTSDYSTRTNDPYSEIDRRNQRVLYPLNAKDSYGKQNHHPTFHYQKTKYSSNSFNIESYNNHCHNRRPSQRNHDEDLHDNMAIPFQTLDDKQTTSSFLYGNSIIKTNKADILIILEQKSNTKENCNTYINKYGVIINKDGPFWPRDYRILYPTPKLLTRELTPKEFYLIVLSSK